MVDVGARLAVVTLNRPERRNALSRSLLRRLWEVMSGLDDDNAVDVIILTGTDPAFCAGVDLKEAAGASGGVLAGDMEMPARGMFPALAKPVIGAVNGPAATGGLELALTCDFLVASDRARFADTHTRVGVMPGGGATVRLARWIGLPRAKQMSVTGNYIDANTALAWGLVNEVVAHDGLLDRCREVAADIVSNDQRGVQQILQTYDLGGGATEDDAWAIERRVSREWAAAGFDPAEIERRRVEVLARAHRS